ncbi:hypothetical protein, partial [Flavobacterium sp. Leaf359]|uniref:hypothetical protein n=1 Tax=Flavobacterium sp. Leaf359 TaxID=1736351 RepID=UPI001F29B962
MRVLNASSELSTLGFNICVRSFPKPANDSCAAAVQLTPGTSCVDTVGTFSGSLLNGAAPTCANTSSQDVWYRFTATEQTMSVNLSRASTNSTMYLAMELYEDSCAGN